MKAAVGLHPLAVASGITPDNIDPMKPFIDYALVSTGINLDFYTFDPDVLCRLAAKLSAGK